MSDITRLCKREKPNMVIIDHLGLIKPSGKYRDRREAVDLISRSLKQLAKELNIPVLCVAQLNRQLINRANKEPLLSDLRESGAIEQDADVVLLLHRPNYYDKTADKAQAYLLIAKNRNGKTGSVPLLWYGSRQRFTEDWTAIADNEISDASDQYYQEVLP
jgi:replicative DNA helicase